MNHFEKVTKYISEINPEGQPPRVKKVIVELTKEEFDLILPPEIIERAKRTGQVVDTTSVRFTAPDDTDIELRVHVPETTGPAIGSIVHYQRFGSPGGEHKAEPSPAIVTQIHPDGDCQLFVMNPNGVYHNKTPYSVTPKPGHWSWPAHE